MKFLNAVVLPRGQNAPLRSGESRCCNVPEVGVQMHIMTAVQLQATVQGDGAVRVVVGNLRVV